MAYLASKLGGMMSVPAGPRQKGTEKPHRFGVISPVRNPFGASNFHRRVRVLFDDDVPLLKVSLQCASRPTPCRTVPVPTLSTRGVCAPRPP